MKGIGSWRNIRESRVNKRGMKAGRGLNNIARRRI